MRTFQTVLHLLSTTQYSSRECARQVSRRHRASPPLLLHPRLLPPRNRRRLALLPTLPPRIVSASTTPSSNRSTIATSVASPENDHTRCVASLRIVIHGTCAHRSSSGRQCSGRASIAYSSHRSMSTPIHHDHLSYTSSSVERTTSGSGGRGAHSPGAGEPQVLADALIAVHLSREYLSILYRVRLTLPDVRSCLRQCDGGGGDQDLRTGDPMVEGLARRRADGRESARRQR